MFQIGDIVQVGSYEDVIGYVIEINNVGKYVRLHCFSDGTNYDCLFSSCRKL
jgi:hypothetical protein